MGRRARSSSVSRVNKSLVESAHRGALFWVLTSATLVAAVTSVIGVVVVREPNVSPAAAVCDDVNATLFRHSGPASLATESDLRGLRDDVADALAASEAGSNLRQSLTRWLDAIDASTALMSAPNPNDGSALAALLEQLDATAQIDEDCAAEGVTLAGANAMRTADGSISADDAHLYCQAARDVLREAADAPANDPHLWDLVGVMSQRSLKGLPMEVYSANVTLLTMFTLALTEQRGYAPAEQGAHVIAAFCTSRGEADWPTDWLT